MGRRPAREIFSEGAERYAAARPRYPGELFTFLHGIVQRRRRAWDCATGNGQAAVGLAAHFDWVVATDASFRQIAHAESRPNVGYFVATAEQCGLRDRSVDLTVVAQALHWLQHRAFYQEVRRVTAAGGMFAAWSYGSCTAGPDVEPLLRAFEEEAMGPYWHPERRWVREGYRTIPFDFPDVPVPPFQLRVTWSLSQLGEYLRSWSAVARYREVHGEDPVGPLLQQIVQHWGPPERTRDVTWPLAVRVGRVE